MSRDWLKRTATRTDLFYYLDPPQLMGALVMQTRPTSSTVARPHSESFAVAFSGEAIAQRETTTVQSCPHCGLLTSESHEDSSACFRLGVVLCKEQQFTFNARFVETVHQERALSGNASTIAYLAQGLVFNDVARVGSVVALRGRQVSHRVLP